MINPKSPKNLTSFGWWLAIRFPKVYCGNPWPHTGLNHFVLRIEGLKPYSQFQILDITIHNGKLRHVTLFGLRLFNSRTARADFAATKLARPEGK